MATLRRGLGIEAWMLQRGHVEMTKQVRLLTAT